MLHDLAKAFVIIARRRDCEVRDTSIRVIIRGRENMVGVNMFLA